MSWIDISVGSGSSGSGSSNNFLGDFINSLGNALSNASSSGGLRGFPWKVGNENDQIVGYYDDSQGYYSVIKKFLAEKNYHSNERLKSAFERITSIQNHINSLNHEINNIQNRINSLNHEIHHLNQETDQQNQALNNLNQEMAGLNNEITANENAINQEQDKLNALELQTNAKKQVLESLKRLEKLKQDSKRLKKQSKWKKQFNFLTDNPPNIQAQQESALNRASNKNALTNFFLTNPYAILPKGFIYEYHNPGKETYNALNAPNNMDGINNQFKTNALNQVLDNSYQKFLTGNDSYNALGDIEQVKALKFYDLTINHNPQSENLESALFFKQISQYAKGLRLKILTAPSSQKDLKSLEKLENTINQEEERLKGKDLNTLIEEIKKEQENALKLKESIKAKQNHTEALKNAINQKEQAKNPIEQQKQNLERQKNEKEQQKQNQQNAKQDREREKHNLNNEIDAIGNERLTFKELGTKDNFLGIQPFLNDNGRRRTYARAFFSDKNKSIREYYELETKVKNILGFYRFGQSDEVLLKRFLELSLAQQNELSRLLLES
ncbi:UV radiation resistance protein [Helicobacter pylori]|uniref:UV radiation resistance protein n=1 Tax=Helicobacter pylori TaxID=210 RepID=A0AAW8XHA1_HELPX|nr:UV radiation resistance protein [Helicobacter pylori]MDU9790721.1 UV radiation resistance protein [Helicobacter pylori]